MTRPIPRWKQKFTQSLPDREGLAAHPWLQPVANRLLNPQLWRLQHEAVARGVAVGTFWAFVIPFAQILVSAAHCTLWRANIPAAAAMTMSTWLNFGPLHALAWAGTTTLLALAIGLGVAGLLAPLRSRLVAGVGLMVLTGLVAGVANAPADPYFAQSLQAWEQGRFVRFHGIAQWVGWGWPYAAAVWLLTRWSARGDRLSAGT